MKENLAWAQSKMEEAANRSRQPAPALQAGDMVYLDGRNMPCLRPNKGLDVKNLGPYPIAEVIDRTCRLELPTCFKDVFPWFYPWLLHLDPNPASKRLTDKEGIADEVDSVKDYYVDEVVDSRFDRRMKDPLTGTKDMLQYKVRYTDSPKWNANPLWQPYTDMLGCEKAIEDFHNDNPKKHGPHELYRDLALYKDLMVAHIESLSHEPLDQAPTLTTLLTRKLSQDR
jgi:hypothetical protein